MTKKWSYVAALMLTAASGLALTSCIDNDEPYGIEQIRLATANLLEAKKSAVNAAQAAQEAQIEIEKIKLQIAQLEAENQKILNEAEAKIKEAQAKAIELEAQAKYETNQAELARIQKEIEWLQAQIDDQKAQTDMYLKEQNAKIDAMVAAADQLLKFAELEYQKTLYAFEQEKAKNADKANHWLYKAWERAFEDYLDQLGEVNWLTNEYNKKVQEWAKAAADLEYVEEKGWVSKHYEQRISLEKAVAEAQADIDKAEKKIAKYLDFIQDLRNIQDPENDLYKLFLKYQEEAKTNEEAWAKAQAEYDAFVIDHKNLNDSINSLKAQVDEFDEKPIEITPYTWDPKEIDEALFKTLGLTDPEVIVPERNKDGKKPFYTLSNVNEADGAYKKAENAYKKQINLLTDYLLDDNDVLWTQARINEIRNDLKYNLQPAYDEAQKNWETAKAAYNSGVTDYENPDFSNIPLEEKVEDAVKAFNEEAKTFNDLRKAYIDANTDYEKAKARAEALKEELEADPNSAANQLSAAREAYQEERIAIRKAYSDALAEAQAEYDQVNAEQQRDVDAAQRDVIAKRKLYHAALNYYDDPEDENVVKAKEELDDAEIAYGEAVDAKNTAMSEALKDQQKANYEALTTRINATKDALDTWAEAKAKYSMDVKDDPQAEDWLAAVEEEDLAQKAVTEAETNWQEAIGSPDDDNINTLESKYNELDNLCSEQMTEVGDGKWNYTDQMSKLSRDMYSFLFEGEDVPFPVAEAPAYDVANGVYVNVKAYLINMSKVAYGELGVVYDKNEGDWEYDMAFLLDADKINKDLVHEYIDALNKSNEEHNIPQLAYYKLYKDFGAYGDVLYAENRIEVGNAVIKNQELLSKAIEPLQIGLDALKESKKTAENEKQELANLLADKENKWNDLAKDVAENLGNLEMWKDEYKKLLGELTTLIAGVEENINANRIPSDTYIDEYIENAIKFWEKKIEYQEKQIAETYEPELKRAEYQLDQYNTNPDAFLDNPKEAEVAYAKAKLDAAKEYLDFLKARADELEARYKAATNQQ